MSVDRGVVRTVFLRVDRFEDGWLMVCSWDHGGIQSSRRGTCRCGGVATIGGVDRVGGDVGGTASRGRGRVESLDHGADFERVVWSGL